MPSFKNLFLNLISIALPLAVSAYVFNELVSSQTEMQNKMNRVLSSYSTNTAPENKINETKVLEKLVKSMLKVSESGKSIFFDKLVLTGTDKPASFKLEDDQGFIWMNSGKTRIFLSASGRDRVEIVTDRFFNRDLTLRRDLDVLRDLEVSGLGIFRGGMNIDGNINAETITLSSAYITENLNIANNLTVNSATLSTAYISGDVTALGNITGNTASFTNLNLSNALSIINGGTGISSTPQNGQLLIGNGSGYSLSYLTAGTNITINTGAGLATINAVAGGTNANNYVNAISFSDASPTLKTLLLSREGISSLAASFSISSADITSALGYAPLRNSSDNMTGNLGIFGSFSAATAQFPNLFANVFSASTANLTDLYSSRFSAANVGITTALSAANASFTTLNAGSFSGTSGFLTNFGVTTDFSAANGRFTNLNATTFSGTSGFLTNFGVTSNLSAATATFRGTVTVSNPSGGTQLNLVSNGGAGNNIELGFYDGATKRANFSMDSTSTFEFEGASGTNVHFNATNGTYRFWNDGNNRFEIGLSGITATTGITGTSLGLSGNINASTGNFTNLNATTFSGTSGFLTNFGVTTDFSAANGRFTNIRNGNTYIDGNNDLIAIGGVYNGGAFLLKQSGQFNIVSGFAETPKPLVLGIGNTISWQSVLVLESNAAINIAGVNSQNVTDDRTLCTSSTNLRLEIKNAACGTSSLRYKENITTLPYGLADIMQLNPVSFNYKDFTEETAGGRTKERIGFIAEEMNEIIPEVVLKEDGIVDSIEYKDLVPLAFKGIQEQQTQINSLSQAIANINISNLENLTTQLMTTLENLSMSTEDGALVVNTNLTVTGEALFNNATFTGNVEIGQVKIDSLENDISIKAASCVDMDGNMNQETCNSNKLSIMQNKAGNVEMFDGQVKFKPNGEVLGKKVQAKTFKNTPSSAPEADASCNAGEFKFAEDNGKVYVFFCSESVGWLRSELSKY